MEPGADPAGYFQSRWPVILILGSFFVLTVPLCFVAAGDRDYLSRWSPGLFYLCGLGMTHFVITLTLYLQGANLRHFWGSGLNRITYFGLPAAIFLFFGLYHTLGIATTLPLADLIVRLAIRLADFQHFGRQGFGVSQLFRKRSACRFPGWMRRAENTHFLTLTLLMFVTYASGGSFRTDRPSSVFLLVLGLVSFGWVLAGFATAWRAGGRAASLLAPLAYVLLQTASAGLAIYSTTFYAFALAMHYVEYHVLMMPRCFHARLEVASRTDRVFGRIRRHKVVFYGLLTALAVPITHFAFLGMGAMLRSGGGSGTIGYRMLISIFDGLFVFHYFIESRVWRFGDPYYRKSLLPLYFRDVAPAFPVVSGANSPIPAPNLTGGSDRIRASV